MASLRNLAQQMLHRKPSPTRCYSTSRFAVIGLNNFVEEERLPFYEPGQHSSVKSGEIFQVPVSNYWTNGLR